MALLALLMNLAPQIISLVQLAESLHPATGAGPTKLQFVTNTIGAIVANIPQVAHQAQDVVNAATPLITSAVNIFNAVGAFKKADVAGALDKANTTMATVAAVSDAAATVAAAAVAAVQPPALFVAPPLPGGKHG